MTIPLESAGLHDRERLEKHRRSVWRFLRFLGADAELADDLTQEVFVRVLAPGFEDRGDTAMIAWLRQTSQHLYRSAGRRLRREIRTLDSADLESAWARVTAADPSGDAHMEALRSCMQKLEPRDRTALQLRHGERMNRTGIARALGVSVEGVKSILRRARERLRCCMKHRLEQEEA